MLANAHLFLNRFQKHSRIFRDENDEWKTNHENIYTLEVVIAHN